MEIEEAAGEEPSTGGIKLFTLADKAEAFIRPACLSPLPNSTRRQLVERFGKPSLPCTSAPYLDQVLRPRLPVPVRARDNELAKIQAMSLDGMFPLCRLLNDAHSGELHLPEIALDAVQTSIRLLGSVTAHRNRLRRTSALQSLNRGIVDMAEEDSIFKDAGLRLFGEGFSEKAKKRDDELRGAGQGSAATSSGGQAQSAERRVTSVVFFPRAKTQNGKHRHFSGSGRGRTKVRTLPSGDVVQVRQDAEMTGRTTMCQVTESPDTILQPEIKFPIVTQPNPVVLSVENGCGGHQTRECISFPCGKGETVSEKLANDHLGSMGPELCERLRDRLAGAAITDSNSKRSNWRSQRQKQTASHRKWRALCRRRRLSEISMPTNEMC